MSAAGDIVTVVIERPAVGGAMIARVDGRILLVTGAIPGERVRVRIDRVARQVAFATTVRFAAAVSIVTSRTRDSWKSSAR
jgi:predicted RNA-binding protein with TRAM domain